MRNRDPQLTGLVLCLYQSNLIDLITAKSAAQSARQHEMTIPQHLVNACILSSEVIYDFCHAYFSLPTYDPSLHTLQLLNSNLIGNDLINRYRILPLKKDHQYLWIAASDPTDQQMIESIQFATNTNIKIILIAENELEKILQQYNQRQRQHIHDSLRTDFELKPQTDHPESAHFVEHLIQHAVNKKASDIHIEPFANLYRVRFRLDGRLIEAATFPLQIGKRIVSRIKILANLNIAEKRLCQDGRLQFKEQFYLNIRVSTCPTLFGEKIVLRLLHQQNNYLSLDQLGLNVEQLQILINHIANPQGLILVTGPTGSGKTTTLYSCLQYLNQITTNIITIEDPIEIAMPGVTQINVNAKIGLGFSQILKSILRQDPDVIMVGEIRDQDTAVIAMEAALTGHLVFSTLHTNNALGTLSRLSQLNPHGETLQAITLIVAQRLLRKLCEKCKIPDPHFPTQYQANPSGCTSCQQGYFNRVGIFELLVIPPTLYKIQSNNASNISKYLLSTLWESGMEMVNKGETSLAELTRLVSKET